MLGYKMDNKKFRLDDINFDVIKLGIEGKILSEKSLFNKVTKKQDKTFSFLFDRSCECDDNYKCDCQPHCTCEDYEPCKHCTCHDYCECNEEPRCYSDSPSDP